MTCLYRFLPPMLIRLDKARAGIRGGDKDAMLIGHHDPHVVTSLSGPLTKISRGIEGLGTLCAVRSGFRIARILRQEAADRRLITALVAPVREDDPFLDLHRHQGEANGPIDLVVDRGCQTNGRGPRNLLEAVADRLFQAGRAVEVGGDERSDAGNNADHQQRKEKLSLQAARALRMVHGLAGSLQIVFRHAVAQRVPGHLEQAARFRHVAAGLLQRFLEHGLFKLFHG